MLKSIEVENFKNFYGIVKIPLKEGINVICGSGDSGKTNLVSAFKWCIGQLYEGYSGTEILYNIQKCKELEYGKNFKVQVKTVLEFRNDLIEVYRYQEYENREQQPALVKEGWFYTINGKEAFYPDLFFCCLFDPQNVLAWNVQSDYLDERVFATLLLKNKEMDLVLHDANRMFKKIYFREGERNIYFWKNRFAVNENDALSYEDRIFLLLSVWFGLFKRCGEERTTIKFIDGVFSCISRERIPKLKYLFNEFDQVIILDHQEDIAELIGATSVISLNNIY